jgi:hypothetical protein
MVRQRGISSIVVVLAVAVALLTASRDASAETYAANQCAGEKLSIAAERSNWTLRIWGLWDLTQFDFLRDLLLAWQDMRFDRASPCHSPPS